jgi:hypothetical protein
MEDTFTSTAPSPSGCPETTPYKFERADKKQERFIEKD